MFLGDGLCRCRPIRGPKHVLSLLARDVARVAWDVLRLEVLGVTAHPGRCILGPVAHGLLEGVITGGRCC